MDVERESAGRTGTGPLARAWAGGQLSDAEFERRIAALAVAIAERRARVASRAALRRDIAAGLRAARGGRAPGGGSSSGRPVPPRAKD